MAEDRCIANSVDRADGLKPQAEPNIRLILENKPNKHMDPGKTCSKACSLASSFEWASESED